MRREEDSSQEENSLSEGFLKIGLAVICAIVLGFAIKYLWGLAFIPLGLPAINWFHAYIIVLFFSVLTAWPVVQLGATIKKAKPALAGISFLFVVGINCLLAYIFSFWM